MEVKLTTLKFDQTPLSIELSGHKFNAYLQWSIHVYNYFNFTLNQRTFLYWHLSFSFLTQSLFKIAILKTHLFSSGLSSWTLRRLETLCGPLNCTYLLISDLWHSKLSNLAEARYYMKPWYKSLHMKSCYRIFWN